MRAKSQAYSQYASLFETLVVLTPVSTSLFLRGELRVCVCMCIIQLPLCFSMYVVEGQQHVPLHCLLSLLPQLFDSRRRTPHAFSCARTGYQSRSDGQGLDDPSTELLEMVFGTVCCYEGAVFGLV